MTEVVSGCGSRNFSFSIASPVSRGWEHPLMLQARGHGWNCEFSAVFRGNGVDYLGQFSSSLLIWCRKATRRFNTRLRRKFRCKRFTRKTEDLAIKQCPICFSLS